MINHLNHKHTSKKRIIAWSLAALGIVITACMIFVFMKGCKNSIEELTKKAEQGDANAQSELGYRYEFGEGVPEDKMKAVELYTKAVEQGNARAQLSLGFCYLDSTGVQMDEKKAVELFTKAAEQGNADAQAILWYCYKIGMGVSEDEEKAAKWYGKVLENKAGSSTVRIRWIKCLYGDRKKKESIQKLTRGAEQGDSICQCELAKRYYLGDGVPQDEKKAVEWFTKAAEQGNGDARKALEEFKK